MKRPNPRLFVTNVFVLFALAPVVRAQPLSLPQLEAKWRALELAERSGIRYAVEHTYSIGGRMRPTFNWAVESSPGNGKAARGRDQVLVWNNQYTFALVTKEGSAEFLLNGLTVGPPGVENDTYSLFIKMNSMHGHIIHPYTYLNDDTAAEMLSSGRLTIDTVNLPDTDGRIGLHGWTEFSQRVGPKVRSEFTAVIDAADGRFHQVTSRVTAFDGKPQSSPNILSTWEYEYKLTAAGPTLRGVQYTTPEINCHFAYTPTEKCDAPPESYRTTHYGIPEPPGINWTNLIPNYVWLLLAAGVLGVVAVGCRWLLKRRATAVPPPFPPTPTE